MKSEPLTNDNVAAIFFTYCSVAFPWWFQLSQNGLKILILKLFKYQNRWQICRKIDTFFTAIYNIIVKLQLSRKHLLNVIGFTHIRRYRHRKQHKKATLRTQTRNETLTTHIYAKSLLTCQKKIQGNSKQQNISKFHSRFWSCNYD